MIIQILFEVILGLIGTVFSAIPSIDFPLDFINGLESFKGIMQTVGAFLPLPTFVICLTVIFALDNIKFLISIFNFIVRKIPTIG